MENLNNQAPNRSLETLHGQNNEACSTQNNTQLSSDIDKNNPDSQEKLTDQRSAQMVHQAINDDEALSGFADDIQVTVKDGAITLNGRVATEQQKNLAANTASAVGMVDNIDNRIVIQGEPAVARKSNKYRDAKRIFREKKSLQESTNALARADDDGFAVSEPGELKKDPAPAVRVLSLPNLHSVVRSFFENSPFFLKKKDS
ncbi:MAG: BON domain-containing protein [Candidatus Omnitrophica bacterium]|nr:BON domain-containing protein [Candidatus Omnitrophota bacterium]